MIVGLTSGCFDLVHFGHIHYLQRCKTLCDRLIVGVDSDAMVTKAKGPTRPVIPHLERLALINSFAFVDSAFLLHSLDDLENVVRHMVNKVFKHEGFANLENVVGVSNTQAELVIVPDIEGLCSTTRIIEKIRALELD
jgi:rfaE bifunctional protein nucleotidyltransferase chain/domain